MVLNLISLLIYMEFICIRLTFASLLFEPCLYTSILFTVDNGGSTQYNWLYTASCF